MKYFCLAVLFLVMFVPVVQAKTVECAKSYISDKKPYMLDYVSVADGPPEEMADLVPDDEEKGIWVLDNYRAPGRNLYLVCHYQEGSATLAHIIPHDVKHCTTAGVCS